jgi:hypothetical protein
METVYLDEVLNNYIPREAEHKTADSRSAWFTWLTTAFVAICPCLMLLSFFLIAVVHCTCDLPFKLFETQ